MSTVEQDFLAKTKNHKMDIQLDQGVYRYFSTLHRINECKLNN